MTTSASDHKRSKRRGGDVFKQPTKHLRRGKACLNCRFLKIKCDGIKPTCGQCIRVPKDDPCEYTDGPSRTVLLQQNVAQLQARIRELEGSSQSLLTAESPGNHFLSSGTSSSGESSSSRIHSPIPPPPYRSSPSLTDPYDVLPQTQSIFHSSLELEDMNDIMLPEIFLPHAAQFGFFLNADRFRETVRSGTSFNDTRSSSPWKALLSTVCLWGIHLSDSHIGTPSAREADLLQRALSHTAFPSLSGLECLQTIQLIQAKVLLATYFLRRNQFMDSDYHISGAVSLCLSLGLHKLSYAGIVSPHSKLTCAESWIDMDERVRGFWTVFALQRHILIVRYPWSNAFGNLHSCQEITTPWPIQMGEPVSTPLESVGTLREFWGDSVDFSTGVNPNVGSSEQDMYVKATILLQKAVYYVSKVEASSEDFSSLYHSCLSVNELIVRFGHPLPPLLTLLQEFSVVSDTESVKRQSIQVLVTTHAIISCARLKVHQALVSTGYGIPENGTGADAGVTSGMIDVALSVLQAHYSLGTSGGGPFNPVSGNLCAIAYEFILREQARVESESVGLYWLERDLPGLRLPSRIPVPPERKERILVVVEESKSIMTYLSTVCPSINYQFERVTKCFDGQIPKSVGL